MMWLNKIRMFIAELDIVEFRRFVIAYIFSFIVCGGLILFYYFSQQFVLFEQISLLNKSRRQVQKVLTDYQKVDQQKKKIIELLSADKSFYLQKFVQELLQALKVYGSSLGKVGSQMLANGYIEESVSVQLKNINTKQLCELLEGIEKVSRVYVKSVVINRSAKSTSIGVYMIVATLKQNSG